MAHKRKDTLVPVGERRKHLKPFEKNKQARRERRAAKDDIMNRLCEMSQTVQTDIMSQMLATEQIILQSPDRALYLECMNKPLSERHTEQEIRDGKILFWMYARIKTSA